MARARRARNCFGKSGEIVTDANLSHLTLGKKADIPDSPNSAVLDAIPIAFNTNVIISRVRPCVRFACPEFTSLCPVTGQPDFAHIVIDYMPDKYLIESKSLKLYLHSFRNHADFHEAVTQQIAAKCLLAANPLWLRIGAYFYPRGGIPIDVFWQTGTAPDGIWIPPQDVPAYRGR